MSEFNLDEWIDGAKVPERSATVYARADLVAHIESLEAKLQVARSNPGDDRLASPDSPEALARQIQEARDEMAGSALAFRFKALASSEVKRIYGDAPKIDDEPDSAHIAREYVAAASVEPRLTPEQAQRIRDKIGEGQFALLWETAFAATNDKKVSVPFSLSASAILSRQNSSES
jgi:hypothetical protein